MCNNNISKKTQRLYSLCNSKAWHLMHWSIHKLTSKPSKCKRGHKAMEVVEMKTSIKWITFISNNRQQHNLTLSNKLHQLISKKNRAPFLKIEMINNLLLNSQIIWLLIIRRWTSIKEETKAETSINIIGNEKWCKKN